MYASLPSNFDQTVSSRATFVNFKSISKLQLLTPPLAHTITTPKTIIFQFQLRQFIINFFPMRKSMK